MSSHLYSGLLTAIRHKTSKPIFVPFDGTTERNAFSAKTLALAALTNRDVGGVWASPLVRASLTDGDDPLGLEREVEGIDKLLTLELDDKEPIDLQQALFPPKSTFLSKKLIAGKKATHLDGRYLRSVLSSWDGKSVRDKFLTVASSFANSKGIAFSVRFSPRRLKTLEANLDDPFRVLKNDLSGLNAFGPMVATMERGKNGLLHIHGMIPGIENSKELREALRVVGGCSPSIHFRNCHQVRVEPLRDSYGWAHYIFEDLVDLPDEKLKPFVYISREATVCGREHMQLLREVAAFKLNINPELRGGARRVTRSSVSCMSSFPSNFLLH